MNDPEVAVEPPPPGGWNRLYLLVLIDLLLTIAVCGWLSGLGR